MATTGLVSFKGMMKSAYISSDAYPAEILSWVVSEVQTGIGIRDMYINFIENADSVVGPYDFVDFNYEYVIQESPEGDGIIVEVKPGLNESEVDYISEMGGVKILENSEDRAIIFIKKVQ